MQEPASAYLELREGGRSRLVPLEGDRITVGRAQANDLPIPLDETLSRLHAVLERLPGGWSVRDLGSRNGTFVNGKRIWAEHALHPNDEIRAGETEMVFRSLAPLVSETETWAGGNLPELTRRERDVLVALCRPAFSGSVFTAPASIRDIGKALFITDGAVKQHLLNLYDKFHIPETGENRRIQLANEAIRRGAVRPTDFTPPPSSTSNPRQKP